MSAKQNIVIIGSSGHSKVVIDICAQLKRYNLVGLIDDFRSKSEETLGYPVLGKITDLPEIVSEYNVSCYFIGIGDNYSRKIIQEKISVMRLDITSPTLIHPSAQIGLSVKIGIGTILMAGVIVNSATEIGDFSIINTQSSIDHDCHVQNFSSIAPGVTMGGYVSVGTLSIIGLGAKVRHKISIGNNTLVGAGSLVLKDIPSNALVYGTPAKFIRTRNNNEKYL
jgi:sugar O-acyltransferase (sialic acid O-acetyltransferase NeuD family)